MQLLQGSNICEIYEYYLGLENLGNYLDHLSVISDTEVKTFANI